MGTKAAKLRKYEVLTQCYVPVGPGLKFKVPGQVVSLDDDDAAELSEFLAPVKEPKGVAKRNTSPKVKPEPEAKQTEPPEEVTSDGGEPGAAVQRAGAEAEQ